MNKAKDIPVAHFGIQKITKNITEQAPGGGEIEYDVIAAYGNGRIRIHPWDKKDTDRGLYIHGKLDTHNWTHGCLCDKSEAIFNYLWSSPYRGEVPLNVRR